MMDLNILLEPEPTNRVAPALMLVPENADSHESVLSQSQSLWCHSDLFEFRNVQALDAQSPGMSIFNRIGSIFCEAAISQTASNYQDMPAVRFGNISRGLLLGLVFNVTDLVVKRPTTDEAILLISRQPCLGSKYNADKKGVRGFQNAVSVVLKKAQQKIVNIQRTHCQLASMLDWLNTSFIGAPKINPTPSVSEERSAPAYSMDPPDDIEIEDGEAINEDMANESEIPGVSFSGHLNSYVLSCSAVVCVREGVCEREKERE
jgi:hypothetical protein